LNALIIGSHISWLRTTYHLMPQGTISAWGIHLVNIGDLLLRRNRMKTYSVFIPVAVRRWGRLLTFCEPSHSNSFWGKFQLNFWVGRKLKLTKKRRKIADLR
jgi:hypothetical protein